MRREELQDSKKVLRLWVHEIGRVFSDRLVSEEDQSILYGRLFSACRDKVREELSTAIKVAYDEKKYRVDGNKEMMSKHIIFGDVMGDGVSTHDRHYDEITP
jgi:dynein heavy chain